MYELSQRPCHVAYGAEKSCQMMSMSGMMTSATLAQSHNWKVLEKVLSNDAHIIFDVTCTLTVAQLESVEKMLSDDAHIIFVVTCHTY